ncbi:MAG: hypothetical protein AB7I04_19160 [Pseudomonadales bacterium]
MRKDYRFLIGQRFAFGGAIYVVQDLTAAEDRTYVTANPSDTDAREQSGGAEPGTETFSLSDVIQWLLVDEEIELFYPNYLAAR